MQILLREKYTGVYLDNDITARSDYHDSERILHDKIAIDTNSKVVNHYQQRFMLLACCREACVQQGEPGCTRFSRAVSGSRMEIRYIILCIVTGTAHFIVAFTPPTALSTIDRTGTSSFQERRIETCTLLSSRHNMQRQRDDLLEMTPCRTCNRENMAKMNMFTSASESGASWSLTRKKFTEVVAGVGLATLLAGPSVADGGSKRTVVVTGANSGLGLDAVTKLVCSLMSKVLDIGN